MNTDESQTTETTEPRRKAGLEPEEFQRRLIFVTVTVLTLGIAGGTCLGTKIERAERIQDEVQAQQAPLQESPSQRANE